MTRCSAEIGALLLTLASSACGDAGPSTDESQEAEPTLSGDAYVLLDAEASAAGWQLRVGGFCLPQSSVLPVAVPEEESVVLERWDGPLHDWQYLYPPAGVRMWVRGFDARIDVVEGAALDRVRVTARDEAGLRGLAAELDVELVATEQGWELGAPDVWSAFGGVGPRFDDAVGEVRPIGGATPALPVESSPRVTVLLEPPQYVFGLVTGTVSKGSETH